jgi:hypothetical protein
MLLFVTALATLELASPLEFHVKFRVGFRVGLEAGIPSGVPCQFRSWNPFRSSMLVPVRT